MAVVRPTPASLLIATIALVCLPISAKGAFQTAPSADKVRAELNALIAAMSANVAYTDYARGFSQIFNKPSQNPAFLINTTVLVPINDALHALPTKTLFNTTAMSYMMLYSVLKKPYTLGGLRSVPPGATIPTMLSASVQRYRSTSRWRVAFGPPGKASPADLMVVLVPNLYNGSLIKAHGVSKFFKPPGY